MYMSHLLHSLERVAGKLRVESGVNASGGDVPSEAGGHGDTAMLELGLSVEVHGSVVLALGETQWVEVADGGDGAKGIISVVRGGNREVVL